MRPYLKNERVHTEINNKITAVKGKTMHGGDSQLGPSVQRLRKCSLHGQESGQAVSAASPRAELCGGDHGPPGEGRIGDRNRRKTMEVIMAKSDTIE